MNEAKLEHRIKMLHKMLCKLSPLFSNDLNEDEKALLTTTVGAAIWYLPGGTSLWSGYISKKAIESIPYEKKGDVKLTPEHRYPRKIAAEELLNIDWDEKKDPELFLKKKYLKEYGVFNYVTSEENKRLTAEQKVKKFTNWNTAYKNANINLIKCTHEQLKSLKRRDRNTRDYLLGNANLLF